MTYSLSSHSINKTSTGVQMNAGKGSRGSSLQTLLLLAASVSRLCYRRALSSAGVQ